jgi:arylsulfatase A-like enzyme
MNFGDFSSQTVVSARWLVGWGHGGHRSARSTQRQRSVSFASHYTASNMCIPSRGVLTTGLYSHQTGCLYTGEGATESTLARHFPTWGTMLRQQGYHTWWWGKWHLGHDADNTRDGLDAHGFSGGTYPSPNGAPNQGLTVDHSIVDQFDGWFAEHAGSGPWCTTVSLVNPRDICWWPRSPLPGDVPHVFSAPPVNFENPEDMHRRGKPQLQIDYMNFMSPLMTGAVPYSGPALTTAWARCLDMYLWLQQQVDGQIGRVLDTLASRADVERETIVIFTSDQALPTEIPTSAPNHIVAVGTADAKLARYSYWKPGGTQVDTGRGMDRELYDYEMAAGAQELDNVAGRIGKQADLEALLEHEVLPEMQAPLPTFLRDAQEQGMADMARLTTLRAG